MKKLTLILFMLTISFVIAAQTPSAFNYLLAVRDASGNISANKTVGIRLSLHQTNPTGTIVYSEKFTSPTDNNGLLTLQVGRGTLVSGNFNTISWGTDNYYMQIEIDYNGGTAYQDFGTSQLLSVPFSLNAKSVAGTTVPLGTYGGIILSQNTATCNLANEGTVMYNTTTKKVQFCDGTTWKNVDGTL